MNRRDLIKSAVALALSGPRFPARAQLARSAGTQSTVLPQASISAPFPRTAIIAISGSGSSDDQHYPPIPYASQVTPIGTDGMFATGGTYDQGTPNPVGWMGRFDVVLIGGNWEQWDQSGKYDRALLVDAVKQITNVSGYQPATVWQYQIFEQTLDASNQNPYNSLYPTIQSELWSLWSGSNESGNQVPNGWSVQGYTGYETNWCVAWPGQVNKTPADQAFATHRTTATYDGKAEDLPQYAAAYFIEMTLTRHSSVDTAVDGTIAASSYTDSRFYPSLVSGSNHDSMKAPNADAIFQDNCFAYPRVTGYYDLQTEYGNEVTSAAGPFLVRGSQHFFNRYQQIIAAAYAGRTYYNVCNFASWTTVHATSTDVFSAMSNGLANTMHGGLLEKDIGSAYAVEANFGWPALLSAYNAMVDFCLQPKQLVLSGVATSTTDYQRARYVLATVLMDDGYCSICTETSGNDGSYRVDDYVWWDEFGGNAGTNIPKGWLGNRIGSRPMAAAIGPVWVADFDNGVVLCYRARTRAIIRTAARSR